MYNYFLEEQSRSLEEEMRVLVSLALAGHLVFHSFPFSLRRFRYISIMWTTRIFQLKILSMCFLQVGPSSSSFHGGSTSVYF